MNTTLGQMFSPEHRDHTVNLFCAVRQLLIYRLEKLAARIKPILYLLVQPLAGSPGEGAGKVSTVD